MLLMLKKSRPGPMNRNVRDDAGNVIRRYEFAPGGVQEVHDDDLLTVADDILSGVLVPVTVENYQAVEAPCDLDELKERVHKLRAAAKAKALKAREPKTKGKPEVGSPKTDA